MDGFGGLLWWRRNINVLFLELTCLGFDTVRLYRVFCDTHVATAMKTS